MEEEEEFPDDINVSYINDVEADTATVIQLAALMLNNDGEAAYLRAIETPLCAVGSTLAMAASMVATLAEHLAEHECCTTEQILLELRNWMEEPGASDG